jgi:hypothetical protein
MRLTVVLVLLALACAACTQGAAPTSSAQALFLADPGPGDREFTLIEITAGNASHTIDGTLTAPYGFYVENALAPVQGIFQPNTANSLADIALLFGGETVPRVVADPSENSKPGCALPPNCFDTSNNAVCLCVNSSAAPTPSIPAGSHEVRFDVTSTPQTLFTATVGGINENYLIQAAQAPASIWVENVVEIAQGVFNKSNANTSLTATLVVDGVVRDTATTGPGSTDSAVVQFQLD